MFGSQLIQFAESNQIQSPIACVRYVEQHVFRKFLLDVEAPRDRLRHLVIAIDRGDVLAKVGKQAQTAGVLSAETVRKRVRVRGGRRESSIDTGIDRRRTRESEVGQLVVVRCAAVAVSIEDAEA